jgi:hypothetical protein
MAIFDLIGVITLIKHEKFEIILHSGMTLSPKKIVFIDVSKNIPRLRW